MFRWVLVLFIVALLAWLFDFAGLAIAAGWLAKLLLFVCAVIFTVKLVDGLFRDWPREMRALPRAAVTSGRNAIVTVERLGRSAEDAVRRGIPSLFAPSAPPARRPV